MLLIKKNWHFLTTFFFTPTGGSPSQLTLGQRQWTLSFHTEMQLFTLKTKV